MTPIRLALVGATGMVGRTTLDVLDEWSVPLESLRFFASDGSDGRTLTFRGENIVVEKLERVPDDVNAAILATSRTISRHWVPLFRERGVLVIDHSSEFRMHEDVPLVIPEVNGHALETHHGVIANPNCSASVVVIPLAAFARAAEMKTVVVDTYQSVSGSGQEALAEFESELTDPSYLPCVYPRVIAHNVFPQVGAFDENGHCDEEQKVVQELRKMLELPELTVLTTTVRVPVRIGHSAAVSVEFAGPVQAEEVEAALTAMPGMVFERDAYRTPREIAGQQEVFVSRLRQNPHDPRWFQFWTVGDNLRKGAASNAVQILMELFGVKQP